jgi:adenylylsulfate kinase
LEEKKNISKVKDSTKMTEQKHIIPHDHVVTKKDRQRLYQHKSMMVWLTGLSGSGKSTIASELEKRRFELDQRTYVLDGDNVRMGLCKDLGFSADDREENIRRIGEVAKLFVDAGIVVITAFISPYLKDRDNVREIMEEGEFVEVHVKCSLEECEKRDPKGLYKKARAGEIKNFTGIDDPYEEPQNPELVVETDKHTVDECVDQILAYLEENKYWD